GTIKQRVYKFLDAKKPGQPDSEEVLRVKTLIRATEARAAALACGIPPEQLEFLDLRFYRTGTAAKNPIHPKDIDDIVDLLRRLAPQQVYVAGELSDPHGTHRICAEAVFEATRRIRNSELGTRSEGTEPAGGPSSVPHSEFRVPSFEVWLYKGAWEE